MISACVYMCLSARVYVFRCARAHTVQSEYNVHDKLNIAAAAAADAKGLTHING